MVTGHLITYENNDNVYFTNIITELVCGYDYYYDSPASNYTVGFRLYSDKTEIPKDVYKTVKLETQDDTLYFCINNIEKDE